MNMHSYSCCSPSAVSADISSLAGILKMISEPNRLRILCLLQNGQAHCVCEFSEHMKDVSQSLLSHHLADLRGAELVINEKRGLKVYYSLTEKGAAVTRTVLSLVMNGDKNEN